MRSDAPQGFVMPDERRAKRCGVVGLIIASIALLTCDLGGAAYYAFLPSLVRITREQQQTIRRMEEQRRESRLKELREEEAAAKSAEEKKEAHDRLVDLESEPPPAIPPMSLSFEGYSDRRVLSLLWTDLAFNFALNVLVIVGGGGLIGLREWGRKITVAAAIFKLVENVTMTLLLVGIAAPIVGDQMGSQLNEFGKDVAASAPNAPNRSMPDLRPSLTGLTAAGYVFMGGLGLIWPIVLLVWASRKEVKAACSVAERTRREKSKPNDEWEAGLS